MPLRFTFIACAKKLKRVLFALQLCGDWVIALKKFQDNGAVNTVGE